MVMRYGLMKIQDLNRADKIVVNIRVQWAVRIVRGLNSSRIVTANRSI